MPFDGRIPKRRVAQYHFSFEEVLLTCSVKRNADESNDANASSKM